MKRQLMTLMTLVILLVGCKSDKLQEGVTQVDNKQEQQEVPVHTKNQQEDQKASSDTTDRKVENKDEENKTDKTDKTDKSEVSQEEIVEEPVENIINVDTITEVKGRVFPWLWSNPKKPNIFFRDQVPISINRGMYDDIDQIYARIYNSEIVSDKANFLKSYSGYGQLLTDDEVDIMKDDPALMYVNHYGQVQYVEDAKQAEQLIGEGNYREMDFSLELIAYSNRDDGILYMIDDGTITPVTKYPVRDIRVIQDTIYYRNEEDILFRFHEGEEEIELVTGDYQVLEESIYYIGENQHLYRYDMVKKDKVLIEQEAEHIISDGNYVYYTKRYNHYEDYYRSDELYRVNREMKSGDFVTILDFLYKNFLCVYNDRIYVGWIEEDFVKYIESLQPKTERFGDKIIYENNQYVIFHVNYVTYEEGYSDIFIYDKVSHKVVKRMDDCMDGEYTLRGDWIYLKSEMAKVYRVHIETLEIQTLYEGTSWGIGSYIYFTIMDDQTIIVSQPDERGKVDNYKINIVTGEKERMPFTGTIFYKNKEKFYLLGEGLYSYTIQTEELVKIADYTNEGYYELVIDVLIEDNQYLYCTLLQDPDYLIRLNKETNNIVEIVTDAKNWSNWIAHGQDVYYQREDTIVRMNVVDRTQKVLAVDCANIANKIMEDNQSAIEYRTIDNQYRLIPLDKNQ